MTGKTIAYYQVFEKLGQDGMGEVYRAADTSSGARVRSLRGIGVMREGDRSGARSWAGAQPRGHKLQSFRNRRRLERMEGSSFTSSKG